MATAWTPLRADEPIGVVALSGPVRAAELDAGLAVLRGWGHPVVEALNLRSARGYLAGSDEERLEGLLRVLDAGVRWIVAARGGYGATRLLAALPLVRMASERVHLVGFSDLTAILNAVAEAGSIPQFHGPMVAAGLARRDNAERLRRLMTRGTEAVRLFGFGTPSVIRHGSARGRAVGGNLSVLTALLGTPWEPRFDGAVLFLEDVGEPLYRLDRMLTHLRCSGRLRRVKALISGSLRGCRPKGNRAAVWRRLLLEAAPPEVPLVAGLPFGHGARNFAFPIGAEVELDTVARQVTWR